MEGGDFVRALLTRGLPGLAIVLLVSLSAADASGAIINWGDTVSHLGEVSNQHKLEVQAAHGADVAVGYHYKYWGLFWVDFWTSSGEYCLYRGESYRPLSPAEAAELLGKPEDELSKPFLYRFPLGWLLLTAVLVIVVLRMSLAKPLKDKINPSPRDFRYLKALAIMAEHATRVDAAAALGAEGQATELNSFEVGVLFLTRQGISQAEAEQNLAQLLAGLPPDVYRLLADERYSRALEIMSENTGNERIPRAGVPADERTGPSGFEAAVLHLLSQGVSRAEAEHNLALILFYLPVHCPSGQTGGLPGGAFGEN
jgi:hypothetical protein